MYEEIDNLIKMADYQYLYLFGSLIILCVDISLSFLFYGGLVFLSMLFSIVNFLIFLTFLAYYKDRKIWGIYVLIIAHIIAGSLLVSFVFYLGSPMVKTPSYTITELENSTLHFVAEWGPNKYSEPFVKVYKNFGCVRLPSGVIIDEWHFNGVYSKNEISEWPTECYYTKKNMLHNSKQFIMSTGINFSQVGYHPKKGVDFLHSGWMLFIENTISTALLFIFVYEFAKHLNKTSSI